MTNVTPSWVFVAIVPDGGVVDIEGLNPWDHRWHPVNQPSITVAHPQYRSQRHKMTVYEIRSSERTQRFAAGEFSNGAWGFYVPRA